MANKDPNKGTSSEPKQFGHKTTIMNSTPPSPIKLQYNKHGELPLAFDTFIQYKNQLYDCIGYITNNANNPLYMMASTWFYNITTIHGIDISNFNGVHITIFANNLQDNNIRNNPSPQGQLPHSNHQQGRSPTNRRSTASQFEYPIGNDPTSVNHYGLPKQGDKWNDLKLQSDMET